MEKRLLGVKLREEAEVIIQAGADGGLNSGRGHGDTEEWTEGIKRCVRSRVTSSPWLTGCGG